MHVKDMREISDSSKTKKKNYPENIKDLEKLLYNRKYNIKNLEKPSKRVNILKNRETPKAQNFQNFIVL